MKKMKVMKVMNEMKRMKFVVSSYIFVIMLSLIWTKLSAGDIFTPGSGNMPFTGTGTNTGISTNTGTVYKPFDAFSSDTYNQRLMAPGDRPGFGEGIGVVTSSVSDTKLFFLFLVIAYALIKCRFIRIKHKNRKILNT